MRLMPRAKCGWLCGMDESEIASAADLVQHYRAMVRAAEADLQRKIRAALDNGLPVTRAARSARITPARVYQIRDGK